MKPQQRQIKPKGGPPTEMTKLKILWLKMPDADRAPWQELFGSTAKIPEIRKRILAELNLNLKHDRQWCRFRDWELDQRARDEEAGRAEDDRRQLEELYGGKLTADEMREKLLEHSYQRTLTTGNFELGLATVREDMRVKQVSLDERQVKLLEKRAAAGDRAQAAREQSKSSKGGITPETLRKIETELRLL
jgi:hypothetical protein